MALPFVFLQRVLKRLLAENRKHHGHSTINPEVRMHPRSGVG